MELKVVKKISFRDQVFHFQKESYFDLHICYWLIIKINGVMHRSKGCLNGENYSLSFLLSILYYVNNKRKLLISFHSKPFQLYILI
jgi:hypothetical protein